MVEPADSAFTRPVALTVATFVLLEVQVATVRNQVALSLFTDFENFTTFKPDPRHEKSVNAMVDQVLAWGGALQPLRKKSRRSDA